MKKQFLLAVLFIFLFTASQSKIFIIVSSDFVFTPDDITVTVTDTVVFDGSIIHPVLEVSQATWNANGATSNGGFSFPSGSGAFLPSEPGVVYYVCTNHASMGMKGRIVVTSVLGTTAYEKTADAGIFVYPNPAHRLVNLSYTILPGALTTISVMDMLGNTIAILINEMEPAGSYERQIRLHEDLQPGLYFVKLSTGGREHVTKLLIK